MKSAFKRVDNYFYWNIDSRLFSLIQIPRKRTFTASAPPALGHHDLALVKGPNTFTRAMFVLVKEDYHANYAVNFVQYEWMLEEFKGDENPPLAFFWDVMTDDLHFAYASDIYGCYESDKATDSGYDFFRVPLSHPSLKPIEDFNGEMLAQEAFHMKSNEVHPSKAAEFILSGKLPLSGGCPNFQSHSNQVQLASVWTDNSGKIVGEVA